MERIFFPLQIIKRRSPRFRGWRVLDLNLSSNFWRSLASVVRPLIDLLFVLIGCIVM